MREMHLKFKLVFGFGVVRWFQVYTTKGVETTLPLQFTKVTWDIAGLGKKEKHSGH